MKNVQSKTLEQPERLKASQVPVGTKFKFTFELQRTWIYEKINEKYIKCLEAPSTYSGCVGESLPLAESEHLEITPI